MRLRGHRPVSPPSRLQRLVGPLFGMPRVIQDPAPPSPKPAEDKPVRQRHPLEAWASLESAYRRLLSAWSVLSNVFDNDTVRIQLTNANCRSVSPMSRFDGARVAALPT